MNLKSKINQPFRKNNRNSNNQISKAMWCQMHSITEESSQQIHTFVPEPRIL